MILDDLTPAEYSLRWQARNILRELGTPGLDPHVSLAMIRKQALSQLRYAKVRLELAQLQAENHDAAEPDDPAADTWCDFCGATAPEGGLVDDGLMPLTGERVADPAWVCAILAACIARRRRRYPGRQTPELQRAREYLALCQEQAAPAIIALAAFVAAAAQARHQEATLALSAPRMGTQPHPGPLYGEAARRARWRYTVSGDPANRAHLLSRCR